MDSHELERAAVALDRGDFFDLSAGRAVFGLGLAAGEGLAEFVERHVSRGTIEELPVPFAAVATDLDTGERVVLTRGSVVDAVRASCAIPGVFEPVRLGGRLLVDGGVVANLPVSVARELGADVVIAVEVTAVSGSAAPESFLDVLFRAINILVHEDSREAARLADVVITPAVGELELLEFEEKDRARRAGVAAARAALPAIRAALDRARSRAPDPAPPRDPR
jgi:NTE family protein